MPIALANGGNPGLVRVMSMPRGNGIRVVIVGGGVAGLEALLALDDLGGDRVSLTLVAPQPDFIYRPLLVEQPFDLGPAKRHELEPLTAEKGAEFVLSAVRTVRPKDHVVELDDGSTLGYDYLVVCAGGRFKSAIDGATTFPDDEEAFSADELLDRAEAKDHRVAFIVPAGVTWSLPLYELALMTQRRAAERAVDAKIAVITPESAPLAIFGPAASTAVGELLATRGIQLFANSTVRDLSGEGITLNPGDRRIGPSESIALPRMEGPRIEGLPADQDGFIPVDGHGRVKGVEDVYAAGDGTNFPIKQGGLGTQQADAVAAHIAHRVGAMETPEPFRPVLRGKLLTGGESMSMRADVAGGGGEGVASFDYLWWPPHKISSRYLTVLLHYGDVHAEPEPPGNSLDVEVALPNDWHEEPMALDPNEPPRVD
jgi:sulfide:quinone oxidoreductase